MSSSISIVLVRSDKTLQNYDIVVEGFSILEAELQQTQEMLAAAEAANRSNHDECKSEIKNLSDDLANCKKALRRYKKACNHISQFRRPNSIKPSQKHSDLSGHLRDVVVCQICRAIPTQPLRFLRSICSENLVLIAFNSTDCRHLYCAACLLKWWESCERPSCYTCHQPCLHPPVHDTVHGLVVLAHEDSKNATTWVESSDEQLIFYKFFAPADQTSTHNNGGLNQRDCEESIQTGSVNKVEDMPMTSGEGSREEQTVFHEGAVPSV